MSLTNLISLNYLVPTVKHQVEPDRRVRGLSGMPRRLLLIGQASGDIALNKVCTVTTEKNAITALGEGSQLMGMWRGAYRNAAPGLPIDVIALETPSTAKAAIFAVDVVANTVQAGACRLYIGGELVRIGVAKDASAAAIAGDLRTAVNANDSLPMVASGTSAEIILTCKTPGAAGNSIDVRTSYYDDDVLAQGLTLTVTSMNVGADIPDLSQNPLLANSLSLMTGGAGTPDLSPVIVALQNKRPTEVVCPYTDSASLAMLELEAERRWNAEGATDFQVISAVRGTEGQLTAFAANRNSPMAHTIATRADMTSPWVTAAMAGAVIESVNNTDPAFPYANSQLVGYLPATDEDALVPDQQNNLLNAGLSVLLSNNNRGYLNRCVTNTTETARGAKDEDWRNLNWVKTNSYWRWFCVNEWLKRIGEYKLTTDAEIPAGQPIMNTSLAQETQLSFYDAFVSAGLMRDLAGYTDEMLVEIDTSYGKVKIQDYPRLITQHYQTEISSAFLTA